MKAGIMGKKLKIWETTFKTLKLVYNHGFVLLRLFFIPFLLSFLLLVINFMIEKLETKNIPVSGESLISIGISLLLIIFQGAYYIAAIRYLVLGELKGKFWLPLSWKKHLWPLLYTFIIFWGGMGIFSVLYFLLLTLFSEVRSLPPYIIMVPYCGLWFGIFVFCWMRFSLTGIGVALDIPKPFNFSWNHTRGNVVRMACVFVLCGFFMILPFMVVGIIFKFLSLIEGDTGLFFAWGEKIFTQQLAYIFVSVLTITSIYKKLVLAENNESKILITKN